MTNKEAIKRLKILTDYEYDEDLEALEMAIKALEEERPQGEWIFKKFDEETGISNSNWCPFCGKAKAQAYDNFCGNCGASMVRGGET